MEGNASINKKKYMTWRLTSYKAPQGTLSFNSLTIGIVKTPTSVLMVTVMALAIAVAVAVAVAIAATVAIEIAILTETVT